MMVIHALGEDHANDVLEICQNLRVQDKREIFATRFDSEPEDFFSTNTDKMSDKEKIPLAIAGLVGISLPFIFGLIALYSAK